MTRSRPTTASQAHLPRIPGAADADDVNTVWTRLHYARADLRRALAARA